MRKSVSIAGVAIATLVGSIAYFNYGGEQFKMSEVETVLLNMDETNLNELEKLDSIGKERGKHFDDRPPSANWFASFIELYHTPYLNTI